jgi:membrane associated rhomboid family serine protease
MNIWQDIKWQFKYGGPLISLIMINIAVFIFCGLLGFVDWILKSNFLDNFYKIFSTYSSIHGFLYHPWGILTGMFLHSGFMHILYNMLFLYWFGTIIQDYIGKSKILPIFFLGGFFSSIISIPFFYLINHFYPNFIPDQGIGASAGVMSIVLAAATLVPNVEISFLLVGRVQIKWIALVYILLDIISIPNNNAGGHIAHLGGALFGFIFIKQLQNGMDLSKPFYAVTDFFSNLFKKKSKLKVEYKKEYVYTSEKTTKTNTAQQKETASKQEKLDAILDKINRSSYESLTKEEKEFLFKISQED